MNTEKQDFNRRKFFMPTEVTPIYIKPRRDAGIEIELPYDIGRVESGQGSQWNLSVVPVTAPIQGITIYDGEIVQEYNETNLNCLTFSGPKRIELAASDDLSAAPYIVFQEVIKGTSVVGWQIYAPTAFEIVNSSGESGETWQTSISTEPVSIKQVRLFEDCNFSIETAPPPIPGALFQKVTSKIISEVNLWR